ncbi:hypothetical protein J4417_05510 [Candidatus Woesearchaeota archaeon]|nr:hypothetical protein [Candidatus Woesearchaeota archaeon]
MVGEKIMPTGVKVISVLYYIGAAFSFLFGLLLIVGGVFIGAILGETLASLSALGSGLFIVLGIALLGVGVLDIFIGRGLWKGQNWTRIAAIVFAILGVFGGINSLISGLTNFQTIGAFSIFVAFVQLAVSLLIGGYLAFAHEVKEAFA